MKKGFTLIELLAVIVILVIIALIVTPVVSNIVANARIAANARSVEGHIRNVELAIISEAFAGETTGDLDSYDTITSGATIESSLSRPGNDNVTCTSYTIKHGTVLSASGCKDYENKWGKTYNYSNSNGAVVEGSDSGSGNEQADAYTYYGIDRINFLTVSPAYDNDNETYYCEDNSYELYDDGSNYICRKCPDGYGYSYSSNMCITEEKELSGAELTREANVYYRTDGSMNEVCSVLSGEQMCFSSILSYDDYTAAHDDDYYENYWYPMQSQIWTKMNNAGVECSESDTYFQCGTDYSETEGSVSHCYIDGYSGYTQCENVDGYITLDSNGQITHY